MTAAFRATLPGLGDFELRRLRPREDLDVLHGWVREARAEFWGMTGHTRREVRETYEFLDGLDSHHAYVMVLAGQPIGIFQTYEPAADPIGEHYPVRAGDFGIHLLMAPAATEVRGFTGTVFDALRDFVFAVPSRQRIVIEPDVRNERSLRRWRRLGFEFGDQVALPDKTAQLAFLNRACEGTGHAGESPHGG